MKKIYATIIIALCISFCCADILEDLANAFLESLIQGEIHQSQGSNNASDTYSIGCKFNWTTPGNSSQVEITTKGISDHLLSAFIIERDPWGNTPDKVVCYFRNKEKASKSQVTIIGASKGSYPQGGGFSYHSGHHTFSSNISINPQMKYLFVVEIYDSKLSNSVLKRREDNL